jgi:hypothetical protein
MAYLSPAELHFAQIYIQRLIQASFTIHLLTINGLNRCINKPERKEMGDGKSPDRVGSGLCLSRLLSKR